MNIAIKNIDNIIRIILLLNILILPVAILPKVHSVFDLGKLAILYTFSIILLCLWIIKTIISKQIVINMKTPLAYLVLAYLVVSVVATLPGFSVNPILSLFGLYRRHEGLLTIICYVILFFISASFFRRNHIQWVIKSLLFITIITTIYGIMQQLHIEPMKWQLSSYRVVSFFGNSNFFGAYLCMCATLSLGYYFLCIYHKNKLWVIFSFICFILAYTCLLLTKNRGGWVGFCGGLLLILIFIDKKFLINRWRICSLPVASILITPFILPYLLGEDASILGRIKGTFESVKKEQQEPTGPAVENIQTIQGRETIEVTGTIGLRFELWKGALALFKDHFLLGTGLESLRAMFTQYRSPRIEKLEAHNAVADRCHNDLLDVATTRGIIGLIVYVSLILSFFILSLRYFIANKELSNRLLILTLTAPVLAYHIQNQFSFNVIDYTVVYYILMGQVVAIISPTTIPKTKVKNKKITIIQFILICSVILISLFLLNGVKRLLLADYYYKLSQNRPLNKIEFLSKAIEYNPYEPYYMIELGYAYLHNPYGDRQKNLKEAISLFKRSIEISPYESFYYHALGTAYIVLYDITKEQKWADLALAACSKTVKYNPTFVEGKYNLAVILSKLGRYEEAIPLYKGALEILPNHSNSIASLINIAKIYKYSTKELHKAQKIIDYLKNNKELIPADVKVAEELSRIRNEEI